jgi:Tfp pilus assembly protein PilX
MAGAVWLREAAAAEAEVVVHWAAVVPLPQEHLMAAECERVPETSDPARLELVPEAATSQTVAVETAGAVNRAAGAANAEADGAAGDSPSVPVMGTGIPTDTTVTPMTMVDVIWFGDGL